MGKILVVAENYLYDKSADTNCMRSVLNGLVEHGHEVTLLARDYENYFKRSEKFNVLYVFQKNQAIIDKLFFLCSKKPVLKLLCQLLAYFIIFLKLDLKRNKRAYNHEYRKAEAEGKPYDCVLSFYCPYISNDIAEYIVKKNKNVKWFMYFFDPHTYNYQYTKCKTLPRRARDEKRWAKTAYGVISSYGILEENERHNFYPYKDLKNIELTLPNLRLNNDNKTTFSQKSDKKRMVYTGKFYKNIRNPEFLIKMLNEMDSQFVSAEFYGDSCDYLSENFTAMPDCVSLKGSIPQTHIPELLQNADILINIGNTSVNQVPSKVFDYIATGKPILNVYFNDNDSSLFYLKKYPSILNVKVDYEIDISKIEDFIKSAKEVSYEQLYSIYKDYLLDTTIQKIIEFLELN